MSELGEISAELNAALGRLARVANRFAELDRTQLAPLQAELSRSPQGRAAASLIDRARVLMRQAEAGATGARAAGDGWLAEHGSGEGGRSAGGGGIGEGGAPLSVEGTRTQGGMAYFDASEAQALVNALAVPPFGGEYTFSAHGSADSVLVGGRQLGASELAELIRGDPEWDGQLVRLLSCDTGRGENPIGAQLADELGVEVVAPDDSVWTTPTGEVVVAPEIQVMHDGTAHRVPDRANPGSWRRFAPRQGKGGRA